MNAKKKIVSIALAASLAATAIVGGTLAYFTDTDDATNTFTVGNVDIVLTEPGWDNGGKAEAEDMYPGEAVAKDPTVTNNGANPAFVRVKVEWPDAPEMSYRTDYVDGKLGDNWVDGKDGYFYYTKILNPMEETDALFDQVVLSTETTNGYDGTYDIVVTAEAIQAQGAAAQWKRVEAMNVTEIANWFETQQQIPYDPNFQ